IPKRERPQGLDLRAFLIESGRSCDGPSCVVVPEIGDGSLAVARALALRGESVGCHAALAWIRCSSAAHCSTSDFRHFPWLPITSGRGRRGRLAGPSRKPSLFGRPLGTNMPSRTAAESAHSQRSPSAVAAWTVRE